MSAVWTTSLAVPSVRASTEPPNAATSSVCMSTYIASKPMIEGVRMRFWLTLRNTTVPTPRAKAATTIAPSIVARRGKAKSKEPRTNSRRKHAMATATATDRSTMRVRGESSRPIRLRPEPGTGPAVAATCGAASRTDMATLPHDESDEHGGADGAEDDRGGDLHRGDDGAAHEVAGEQETHADDRHPGQVAAHVVADEHRDDVGHDEPEERDEADDHGGHPGGQGHHRGAEQDDLVVLQAHAGGQVLAEAGDGEAVGEHEGEGRDDEHGPQRLVEPAHHAGEAARAPRGHRLEHVEVAGEEGRDRADHCRSEEHTSELQSRGHLVCRL